MNNRVVDRSPSSPFFVPSLLLFIHWAACLILPTSFVLSQEEEEEEDVYPPLSPQFFDHSRGAAPPLLSFFISFQKLFVGGLWETNPVTLPRKRHRYIKFAIWVD